MQNRIWKLPAIVTFLLALSSQSASAERAPLLVKEFDKLPPAQQDHVLSASLQSARFILFFDNAESMKSLPKMTLLSACLMDRDTEWLQHAYDGYKQTRKVDGYESAGAVFAKSIAWRCGFS